LQIAVVLTHKRIYKDNPNAFSRQKHHSYSLEKELPSIFQFQMDPLQLHLQLEIGNLWQLQEEAA
jgi:hypothetical protein